MNINNHDIYEQREQIHFPNNYYASLYNIMGLNKWTKYLLQVIFEELYMKNMCNIGNSILILYFGIDGVNYDSCSVSLCVLRWH